MAIQTSYASRIDAFQVGQIPNQEPHTVISRIVESAAGLAFGKVAIQGADDKGVIVPAAAGTGTPAAAAGNTSGSGTIASVTVGAGAKNGVYNVVCIEPATNAGKFEVYDPEGILVGVATVAVEFVGGGLTFTITDATDFVSGDRFTITVAGAPVFRGITVRDPAQVGATADLYPRYSVASLITKGPVVVTASVAVTAGQQAYFVPAGGAITNVPAGNLPIPGGFFDTSAAQNALCVLRLN